MGSEIIRILHLDDDVREAELAENKLREAGLQADWETVDSWERFAEALQNRRFDMIISDCSRPAFDALTAFQTARKLGPEIPFVFYSPSLQDHEPFGEGKNMTDATAVKGDIDGLLRMIKAIAHPNSDHEDVFWKSIAESRTFLKFLCAESRDGILMFDQEGIVRFWNRALTTIYGIEAGEAMGTPFVDVLSRVTRTGEDLLLYNSFLGQPLVAREGTHIHPALHTRLVTETSYWPLRRTDDAHAGGIVLVRDVTRQRETESAHRRLDARFQRLFLEAPEVELVTDADGIIRAVNDKASRIVQFSRGEMEGRHMADLFAAQGEAVWSRITNSLPAGGEIELEEKLVRRDGTVFDAELSISSLAGNEVLVIVRDRSDARAREERLRLSEESFRSLGEMADDLILAVSQDGIVNFLNATFTRVTGWSPSLWLGRDIGPLIHPDDIKLFEYVARQVCSGSPGGTCRIRFRCTDGSYCVGESTTSPILKAGGITGTWHIVRLIPEPELNAKREILLPMN